MLTAVTMREQQAQTDTHTRVHMNTEKHWYLEENKYCLAMLLSEKGRISQAQRMDKNTFYILHCLKISSAIL